MILRKSIFFLGITSPKKNRNVIPCHPSSDSFSHLSKERLFGPGAGFQVAESEALKDFGSSFGDLADLVPSGGGRDSDIFELVKSI